ncbi:MAG: iscA [Gammaproteobacteria bacterium]|jgi:iron-sulfur cluster assembly protein|nr:iscA [Gammaproteobacteria bacterium]
MSLITLTDAAVSHIKNNLEKKNDGIGFRLSIKKTGCSGYAYVPSIIHKVIPNDLHFTAQEGLSIYIDREWEGFIKGTIIDYVADKNTIGLPQKRLVFINPNEKNRCGCGESFTTE